MQNNTVLISGASIGGPALAYWLAEYGFEVTVVERAPAFRPGGQAVDVRGPALDVAERMGVLDELRASATDMRGMSVVDATGKELYRSTEGTISGGDFGTADVEILRDDLCQVLFRSTADRVEYLFDDSIAALSEDAQGLHVSFENGPARTFDLVVGADGLHSNTRRLAFGPEADCITHLGTYLSVFTAPNYLELDRWQVWYQGGAAGGAIMTARGNTEIRVFVGFETPEPVDYDFRDIEAQKKLVHDRLVDVGWEFPRALQYMWDAPDFHFDSMSQIHLEQWWRGRVALIGDAGYCGSPLSGQGTSMAMVGAYVLAGELKAAGGDHRIAYPAYQDALRGYVADNQRLALTNKARMAAETGAAQGEAVADTEVQDIGQAVNGLVLKDY
ncbi:FAD-dependent monooxygenase [Streptomyces sp. H39-S7]|uniref:FAD-dependent monooxygenase n=1 Tax=Streptomyces sp. H39-S7 TaxID=3004357 RepID=UPI0022B02068|nr:FAD-dependent monooxygenase [Streptomyces sp. H39-S7]MCZ4121883.1 FAD-dependent monooxygenase [Streptomyces sp. H39-S7]